MNLPEQRMFDRKFHFIKLADVEFRKQGCESVRDKKSRDGRSTALSILALLQIASYIVLV